MAKRPSLFAAKSAVSLVPDEPEATAPAPVKKDAVKAPSRVGKRVLSVYLDPIAWKQLRQLALDADTSTQALGEEAINLLFAKHGINRSA